LIFFRYFKKKKSGPDYGLSFLPQIPRKLNLNLI
jgi:hypothetical protein